MGEPTMQMNPITILALEEVARLICIGWRHFAVKPIKHGGRSQRSASAVNAHPIPNSAAVVVRLEAQCGSSSQCEADRTNLIDLKSIRKRPPGPRYIELDVLGNLQPSKGRELHKSIGIHQRHSCCMSTVSPANSFRRGQTPHTNSSRSSISTIRTNSAESLI